jgi:hypothetical protein
MILIVCPENVVEARMILEALGENIFGLKTYFLGPYVNIKLE